MKTYRVKVSVLTAETWEIEAESFTDARIRWEEGTLKETNNYEPQHIISINCTDEACTKLRGLSMERPKHTPAPWHIVENKRGGSLQVCDTIFHEKGETSLICGINTHNPFMGIERARANARLIACAPELYEAAELAEALCNLITAWCDAPSETARSIMDEIVALAQDDTTAQNAINKAKGL